MGGGCGAIRRWNVFRKVDYAGRTATNGVCWSNDDDLDPGAVAMDLTTLTMVVMLALAAVGVDTVWHPPEVILEGSTTGKFDKVTVDQDMINGILKSEVDRISSTP